MLQLFGLEPFELRNVVAELNPTILNNLYSAGHIPSFGATVCFLDYPDPAVTYDFYPVSHTEHRAVRGFSRFVERCFHFFVSANNVCLRHSFDRHDSHLSVSTLHADTTGLPARWPYDTWAIVHYSVPLLESGTGHELAATTRAVHSRWGNCAGVFLAAPRSHCPQLAAGAHRHSLGSHRVCNPLEIGATAASGLLCRAEEILSRKWAHIDLKAGLIHLLPGETKNGKGRASVMTGPVAEMLRAMREADPTGEFVFTHGGQPIRDFRAAWNAALERAGFVAGRKGKTFHGTRRSFATDLMRAGVDIKNAMALTGHVDANTFRRYQQRNDADAVVAARKLEEYRNAQVRSVKRRRK